MIDELLIAIDKLKQKKHHLTVEETLQLLDALKDISTEKQL